jgi:hypothetical protein
MILLHKNTTKLLLAIVLTLGWSVAFSEPKASDIAVKGRATPQSGIENMKTFCIHQIVAEKSAHLYKEYPGVDEIIESAIDANLIEKGFKKASDKQCDIEMRYGVALQEQHQLSGERQPRRDGRTERNDDTKIDIGGRLRMGKVDLNAYEKSTNRHIWKGEAANTKGVYIDLKNPKEMDMNGVRDRIGISFKRLFKRFPARAGK